MWFYGVPKVCADDLRYVAIRDILVVESHMQFAYIITTSLSVSGTGYLPWENVPYFVFRFKTDVTTSPCISVW